MIGAAQALVAALAVYAAIGLGFGLWFVARGAARLDPLAATGTTGFRLLILPGAAALWPILLRRILRGPPPSRDPHRREAA